MLGERTGLTNPPVLAYLGGLLKIRGYAFLAGSGEPYSGISFLGLVGPDTRRDLIGVKSEGAFLKYTNFS